jgi:hypothetical protein
MSVYVGKLFFNTSLENFFAGRVFRKNFAHETCKPVNFPPESSSPDYFSLGTLFTGILFLEKLYALRYIVKENPGKVFAGLFSVNIVIHRHSSQEFFSPKPRIFIFCQQILRS